MIVLDTSAILDLIEGNEKGNQIQQYIEKEETAITTITVHELLRGSSKREKETMFVLFKTAQILAYDYQAALWSVTIAERLYAKGRPIGDMDMLIAAICVEKGLHLLTTDGDFKRVEGLKVTVV